MDFSVQSQVTVVCVTYESEGVIDGWLSNVRAQLPYSPIVVVDNASGDRTVEVASAHVAEPRVIEAGGNVGFARGCNLGAKAARTEYVMFLNPDARITLLDDTKLSAALAQSPTGILVPLMAVGTEAPQPETYKARGPRGEWCAHVLGPVWPRKWPSPWWRVRRGRDWASGAALIVASKEFEALRGFDESFFLLYEDRDLSFRYVEAGHPMRTCHGIVVSHDIGTSSSAEGLDVRRRAWAVLSWIELRCAEVGAEAGAATARRVCAALRWEGLVGGILAASGFGGSRFGRKLREAGEIERSVRAGGGVEGRGYYLRASRALSGEKRGSDE